MACGLLGGGGGGWTTTGARAQTAGGYTQPYRGAQPWTLEPVSSYHGLGAQYGVTRFSSVRLAGLPLDDPAAVALGLYSPIDADGDGAADTRDGRPVYAQRDVRDVQPSRLDVESGVRVGRHYLYYRNELGGWAVHTQVVGRREQKRCTCSTHSQRLCGRSRLWLWFGSSGAWGSGYSLSSLSFLNREKQIYIFVYPLVFLVLRAWVVLDRRAR